MFSNSRHDELEPRTVPKPTQFQEISAKPEVPELSVVFETLESISKSSPKNPLYATSQTTQETYNEWKNRQNQSPTCQKETRYYSEQRDKQYYSSSLYSDCDQNPYNRFSDRTSYKSAGSEYHKCACQNTPTVKDIYSMMQIQNEQMKFLLETIQKLLVTVLSNQQTHHKCCCSENPHSKKDEDLKKSELLTKDNSEDCQLKKYNQLEKPQARIKKNKIIQKKNEPNKISNNFNKINVIPQSQNIQKTKVTECDNSTNKEDNKINKEKTYSIASDESFELNSDDVHVTETPVSPEQSIHIEMVSSEDSSNSDCEKENDKKIEVGWTMYKNIIGQVNNLLEDKNELKSEAAKPVECIRSTPLSKPKNGEPHKHFILPENRKIDTSLQMQALAMQYLSPEQAVKFDINKHFVPTTQPSTMKSPNNYSISTLHYMERYHLIAPEKNYTSENQQKSSTEDLSKKKKKSLRKNKTPSKILNITELKQQPKLT